MDTRYMRDRETGAVFNNDVEGIRAAKERKAKLQLEKEKHEKLEKEVTNLKDDISEIKNLLKQVLNGTNND